MCRFTAYHERKTAAKLSRDESRLALNESVRLGRALRLPMLADAGGPILRERDRRRS